MYNIVSILNAGGETGVIRNGESLFSSPVSPIMILNNAGESFTGVLANYILALAKRIIYIRSPFASKFQIIGKFAVAALHSPLDLRPGMLFNGGSVVWAPLNREGGLI